MNLNKNGSIKELYVRNVGTYHDAGYDDSRRDWYHVDELPDYSFMRENVRFLCMHLTGVPDVEEALGNLCDELGLDWAEKKIDARGVERLPNINRNKQTIAI